MALPRFQPVLGFQKFPTASPTSRRPPAFCRSVATASSDFREPASATKRRSVANDPWLACRTAIYLGPFTFWVGLSPVSFDSMCRIVFIMARIASGRVSGALCLAIQASSADSCGDCRRTFPCWSRTPAFLCDHSSLCHQTMIS